MVFFHFRHHKRQRAERKDFREKNQRVPIHEYKQHLDWRFLFLCINRKNFLSKSVDFLGGCVMISLHFFFFLLAIVRFLFFFPPQKTRDTPAKFFFLVYFSCLFFSFLGFFPTCPSSKFLLSPGSDYGAQTICFFSRRLPNHSWADCGWNHDAPVCCLGLFLSSSPPIYQALCQLWHFVNTLLFFLW